MNQQELNALHDWVLANIPDNGHAILSPSGWAGWSRCTGMMLGMAESRKVATDNVASVEGTTGHTLLELAIRTWTHPDKIIGGLSLPDMVVDVERWFNNIFNNENNSDEVKKYVVECRRQILTGEYTEEMRTEIGKCYDRLKAYRDDGWTVLAESKVSLFGYFGHKHCDGTSDIIMYKGLRLIVADLKYGKGIEVSPVNSGQLSLYGGGAIADIYAKTGVLFERITLVIMQPRINNGVWKVWETTYSGDDGLYAFLMKAKDYSLKALQALKDKVVTYAPSEAACMWCHKRLNCSHRAEFALQNVRAAFASIGVPEDSNERPDGITNETIALILDRTPFITSLLNDMAEEAQSRQRKGQKIPGRKMVKGRNGRKWKLEDQQLLNRFVACGISPLDCIKNAVKSPAQMDKIKLTDEQKKVVKAATLNSRASDIMVSESDPRPAVKDVATAFAEALNLKPKEV